MYSKMNIMLQFNYGGHGFCHLLSNVAPQMLHKGISQETVDHIMIHNPQQWLGISQDFQSLITLN
jgi:predicted metal-dependent phosphotriesterase family hydrolase